MRIASCKLCTDGDQGIVVGGEYRLTQAQFEEGYNVATLMARWEGMHVGLGGRDQSMTCRLGAAGCR
jgi:hypothetical protein